MRAALNPKTRTDNGKRVLYLQDSDESGSPEPHISSCFDLKLIVTPILRVVLPHVVVPVEGLGFRVQVLRFRLGFRTSWFMTSM